MGLGDDPTYSTHRRACDQAVSIHLLLISGHILQRSDNKMRPWRGDLLKRYLPLHKRFFQSPVWACACLVPHWSDLVVKRTTCRFVVRSETGVGGFEIVDQILRW